MRGRKPTPTAVFLLKGKPSHSRQVNRTEPKPLPVECPTPPSWLGPVGTKVWQGLAPVLGRMKVLTEADLDALALLCDAEADYLMAKSRIKKYGLTYTKTNDRGETTVLTRPEVALKAKAWGRTKAMMVEFGLTPSSRTRLHVQGGGDEDPLAVYLRQGKELS